MNVDSVRIAAYILLKWFVIQRLVIQNDSVYTLNYLYTVESIVGEDSSKWCALGTVPVCHIPGLCVVGTVSAAPPPSRSSPAPRPPAGRGAPAPGPCHAPDPCLPDASRRGPARESPATGSGHRPSRPLTRQ